MGHFFRGEAVKRCIVLFLLLLAACAGGDPYSQIAAGQAALQATAVAQSAARQATQGAINAMQYEQTQLAGEALALQAQAKGTQEAIAYEQTSVAVQDTRAASDLQSTQLAVTASALELQTTLDAAARNSQFYATQTAIPLIITAAVRAENRSNAIRWTGIIFLFGMGCATIFAFVMLVDALHKRSLAGSYERAARAGYFADSARGKIIDQLPAGPAPLPGDNGRGEIIELLRVASSAVGPQSRRIPRYSDLPGWSGPRWSKPTQTLQHSGAIMIIDREGTFIKQPYKNIDGLYQAVVSGRLILRPPLPTGMSTENAPEQRTEQRTGFRRGDGGYS